MSRRFFLSACAAVTTCLLAAGAAAAATAKTAWPSLQSQLARDRVPAGSALAKLIADNQDFRLLRPEEAYDKVPVPAWLRVVWRKDHPDMRYVPGDGTGGYPLVLKEVHEWMVSHPDLTPGSPGRDPFEKKKPTGGPKPTPGPDFSISGNQFSPRSESDIRINFWDPSRIVGSSNNLHGGGSLAMFYSSDGGATWKQTVLPREVQESFQSDPAVDWTSDGTAWATTISVYTSPTRLFLHSYKSTDGGATWRMDQTISAPDQSSADKQMMWVDHSEQSPFKDTIHIIWHDGRAVFVSHHTPGGGWSDPLQISGGETIGTGIGSDIKTDALGRVYAFWPDTGSRKIYFAKSTNGGESFSRPVAISPTFQSFQTVLPAQYFRGALLYTTGAVQATAKSANVYVAWADLAGGRGCSTPFDDPQDNVNSACKTRIWFSRSVDGGTKWSKAKALNNPAAKNDQFNPWLAFDEGTGLLGLMYYDTVGEARTRVNVFFQSSANAGVTWSSPVRVTSASSDDNTDLNDPNQFGDYNALSGFGGTFFPSWTDRRDPDGKEEIWTAPIRFQAKSCEGTGSDTAGLKIFVEGLDDLFAGSCAP